MPVPTGSVRHADDLAQIIHAKSFAVVAVGQNAQCLHSSILAPQEGIRRCRRAVGTANDLSRSVDRIRPALSTARQRTQILHASLCPQDGMRTLNLVVG